MGAEYQEYRVKAKDIKELKEKYKELVQEAILDHGRIGYTGTIAESPGLEILDVTLPLKEAEKYLEEKAEKWEDTLAIKISDKENLWLLAGVYSC